MATVHIHEFVDEGLGHSSYLIDLGDGAAALIDPPRFPTAHEALAAQAQLKIAWTVDTHSHADYLTGSPGAVDRDGAIFVAPAASQLDTPHHPVHDGDRVVLSERFSIIAMATPGHTPDHHAYLLEDGGSSVGLFTGGSLMVGSVGRTDLCGPDLAVPLAHDMYRSLKRFDALADDLAVYPTHGAGSFCGAPGGAERTSTLGRERATNPLLRIGSEDEFVDRLVSGFGTFPSYFARLPEVNRRGPTAIPVLPLLARLSPDDFERQIAGGALVVDARPFAAFGEGHIAKSLSNTLRPVFASWLGWLVEPDLPLLFVLDDDQDRADLVRQCLDVGLENLVGGLDGSLAAWMHSDRPVEAIPVVGTDHLAKMLVDVRQANEFGEGHVPGAINVEVASVAAGDIPATPVTVMCGHGERAMTAASMLAGQGHHAVSVFDGGPGTWAEVTGRLLVST